MIRGELILWRHAEAEEGSPDLERQLTAEGRRQAHDIAQWLRQRLPESARILVSPAVRTRQTAQALDREFRIEPSIGPGAGVEELLRAAHWPHERGPTLIVGHQPTLGQVAALLLAGKPLPWSVRKGAVWWIARRNRGAAEETVLKASVAPDTLRS